MIEKLLDNNRAWAKGKVEIDAKFFARLGAQQSPEYLWIGCSDSRVPANEIVGMDPGELFVHRNVSNLVYATDLNAMAVIQYAIEVLKVRHIIVCGHYGCGGIRAAIGPRLLGLPGHWLSQVRVLAGEHRHELTAIPDEEGMINRLCEMNVIRQVQNLALVPIVRAAWDRGQEVHIHGWIYGISDGLLRNLDVSISG